MWLLLICLFGLVYAQDSTEEEDFYKITKLLQDALLNNDTALNKLNGVFFRGQYYKQNTVKVNYILHIPQCDSNCNCWDRATCNCNISENCSDGYCRTEKEFIWDRVPEAGQDSIYSKCPFIIGSISETSITIEITNRTILDQIPCTWCCLDKISTTYIIDDVFDTIFHIAQFDSVTLLDHALLAITERVSY